MQIQQVSVFLENSAGRLADVTDVIARANIDIRALCVADTRDFGILRLIVDKPEAATEALAKAGYTTRVTEVLAVEVEDKPGGLARVMQVFKDTGVNIEYLYASLEGQVGKAVMIFKVEDVELGRKIVREHGLSVPGKF